MSALMLLMMGSCWVCHERVPENGSEKSSGMHDCEPKCLLSCSGHSSLYSSVHAKEELIVQESPVQESPVQESPVKPVQGQATGPGAEAALDTASSSPGIQEKSLFDGKDLGKWSHVKFGGDGAVEVRDGNLVLGVGDPLTGVVYDEENLPQDNYEIELEARREEGIDFFCCLTFPVNDSHCSLVVGGWAGTVVGLSNLDDLDASRNETSSQHRFESQKWYRIKVRVESPRIQCWIDDKQVVDADTTGREIGVRNEVRLCRPLGLCTFQTQAGIRNIVLRTLKAKSESETGK